MTTPDRLALASAWHARASDWQRVTDYAVAASGLCVVAGIVCALANGYAAAGVWLLGSVIELVFAARAEERRRGMEARAIRETRTALREGEAKAGTYWWSPGGNA